MKYIIITIASLVFASCEGLTVAVKNDNIDAAYSSKGVIFNKDGVVIGLKPEQAK